QLVVMTAAEVGNYGVNAEDSESVDGKPKCSGFVVRHLSPVVSNWRANESLSQYLERHGVIGISEGDTRKLTRHLRDHGSQNAAIGKEPYDVLLRRARAAPDMNGLDLVSRVTPKAPYTWSEGRGIWSPRDAEDVRRFRVACLDFGIKRNILRCL